MNSFEYYNPVRIVVGAGKISEVGERAAGIGNRVCVVSQDESENLRAVCARVTQKLEEAGITVFSYLKIQQNPDISSIKEASEFCKENKIDLVLGIGGGSAMDAAKAIAAAVYYEGELWNMVYSRHAGGSAVPPEKALPLMMIPTLPATGSEMNQCAVVSNREFGEKSYIWAECIYPQLSIIDPELTLTLPPYMSACAAADSISHVLEIYINGEEDSPLQHSFQEGVMRTVIDNIRIVLKNPADIEARTNLQWAATCAINGWASPADAWTPIHQVAHNLTSLFGVAHGASLSALMPAWMKTFSSRREVRYLDFAKNVMKIDASGKSDAEIITAGIEAFEVFLKEIGVPVTLSEVGVKNTDLQSIVESVKKVSFNDNGVLSCNPVVTHDDIMTVLKSARPE